MVDEEEAAKIDNLRRKGGKSKKKKTKKSDKRKKRRKMRQQAHKADADDTFLAQVEQLCIAAPEKSVLEREGAACCFEDMH